MKLAECLRKNAFLMAALLVFVFLSILFFPRFYASIDEHEYLRNAVLLQRGGIAVKEPFHACRSNLFTSWGYVSAYPIGRSLFLIPFAQLGLDWVMASGMILHIINFILFILILKRLKVRSEFSVLYLFFPAILWISRTLYSDILVLTAFFAGTYFYLNEGGFSWLLSGFFFGSAFLVRHEALIGLAAFCLPQLLLNRKKLLCMLAGAAPFLVAVPVFNVLYYGSAVKTGYGHTIFDLIHSYFIAIKPDSIVVYALVLLAYYPLMLLSPLSMIKRIHLFVPIVLLSACYLLIAAHTSIFAFELSLESILIGRMRYLVPAIGMLLISYSFMLNALSERYLRRLGISQGQLFLIMLFVLSLAAMFICYKHADFINSSRYAVFNAIYAHTDTNSLVIGSSDDAMYFVDGFFPPRRYLSVDLNQCLAGNPQGLKIEDFISGKPYVLMLDYPYLEGRTSQRQGVINRERQKMVDFIAAHEESLEPVYHSEELKLEIYRFK